jgi:hypothetical protein
MDGFGDDDDLLGRDRAGQVQREPRDLAARLRRDRSVTDLRDPVAPLVGVEVATLVGAEVASILQTAGMAAAKIRSRACDVAAELKEQIEELQRSLARLSAEMDAFLTKAEQEGAAASGLGIAEGTDAGGEVLLDDRFEDQRASLRRIPGERPGSERSSSTV